LTKAPKKIIYPRILYFFCVETGSYQSRYCLFSRLQLPCCASLIFSIPLSSIHLYDTPSPFLSELEASFIIITFSARIRGQSNGFSPAIAFHSIFSIVPESQFSLKDCESSMELWWGEASYLLVVIYQPQIFATIILIFPVSLCIVHDFCAALFQPQ